MPPPKHSRVTVPAPYVLTLVEGLAALEVPDRPTDRVEGGGGREDEELQEKKQKTKEERKEWIMKRGMRGGPI